MKALKQYIEDLKMKRNHCKEAIEAEEAHQDAGNNLAWSMVVNLNLDEASAQAANANAESIIQIAVASRKLAHLKEQKELLDSIINEAELGYNKLVERANLLLQEVQKVLRETEDDDEAFDLL